MQKTEDKQFLDVLTETLTLKREALHAPQGEVEPGEQVLGTLEDERVRALFSLRVMLGSTLRKFNSSLPNKQPDDNEILRLNIKGRSFVSQFKIVDQLFWEGLHAEFPASKDPRVGVGLRKGWSVVIFKQTRSSAEDFLRSLFE